MYSNIVSNDLHVANFKNIIVWYEFSNGIKPASFNAGSDLYA